MTSQVKAWNNEKAQIDSNNKALNERLKIVSDLSQKKTLDATDEYKLKTSEASIISMYKAVGLSADQAKKAINTAKQDSANIQQASMEYMLSTNKKFRDSLLKESTDAFGQKYIEDLSASISNVDPDKITKKINDAITSIRDERAVPMTGLSDIFKQQTETIDDYSSKIKDRISALKQELSTATSAYGGDATRVAEINKQLSLLDTIAQGLNITMSGGSRGGGSSKDMVAEAWQKRIELLKKINDDYQRMIESTSPEEATKILSQTYKEELNKLDMFNKDGKIKYSFSVDDKGFLDSMAKMASDAGEKYKFIFDKTANPIIIRVAVDDNMDEIKQISEEVTNAFTGYEFSIELDAIGVSSDLFKEMLGNIGASDLDIASIMLNPMSFDQYSKIAHDKIALLRSKNTKEATEEADKLQKQLTGKEVEEAKRRFGELATLREKYDTPETKIEKIQKDIEKWSIELSNSGNKEQQDLLNLRIKNGKDAILALKSEALQLTDFWRNLFGDIEYLGIQSLQSLIDKSYEIIQNKDIIRDEKGDIKSYSSSYTENGVVKNVTLTIQQYQQLLRKSTELSNKIAENNPFKAVFDSIKKGKTEGESAIDFMNRLDSYMSSAVAISKELATNLGTIFGANDEAQETLSSIMGIVEGVSNLGMGVAKISSGDIIGGTIESVKGLANIIGSLTSIGDNRKERKIKREQENIENLQRAYENLGEAIENAYSFDTLGASNKAAQENIDQQIKSYENMISLEESKKKTDKNKIKDYQNTISDLYKQEAELKEKYIKDLGGFGSDENMKSASQEFIDAWFDAFDETGNGLKGLNDKFNDFIQNVIKRQAMLKFSERFLSPLYKAIDNMFEVGSEGGEEATKKELDYVNTLAGTLLPQLNDALTGFANSIGYTGDTANAELSGLQKGIQGVTEDTAQALEALLNSMRFFVADSNNWIKKIYSSLSSQDANANPILAELRLQTEQIKSINSFLLSVGKAGHPQGGYGMKVFIN